MGSLGSGELIVIAVVALIVFGPKRLPELARKASELLAKTRDATKSVTDALDTEYDGVTAPLKDLKTEYDSTVKGFKDAASTATNFSVDLTSTSSNSTKKPENTPDPAVDSESPDSDSPVEEPDPSAIIDKTEDGSEEDA